MKTTSLDYQQAGLTLARLWLLTRRDGVEFAFTDHDKSIKRFGKTFAVSSSFNTSSAKQMSDMSVGNAEMNGFIAGAGISVKDAEHGLFDGAQMILRQVDWTDADDSTIADVLMAGEFGNLTRKGGIFVAELRSKTARLQNIILDQVLASCSYKLGDNKCKVDLTNYHFNGAVTAATDNRQFDIDLTQPANYFTFGVLTWLSGDNVGLSMEVKMHTHGHIELQEEMSEAVEIGDTFIAEAGCNKLGRAGDCKNKFHNYLRFPGFEDVPGQDRLYLFGGQ